MENLKQEIENKGNNLEGKKVTGKKVTVKKSAKKERELKKFKTVLAKKAIEEMPELKEILNCKDFKVTRIEIKIIPTGTNKEITSHFKLAGTKSQGYLDSEY
jgi:hypothetical protein